MLSKVCFAVAALAVGPASAIWPVPVSSSLGNETLFIDQTVKVTYNGDTVWIPRYPQPNPQPHPHPYGDDDGGHHNQELLAETRLFFPDKQINYAHGYTPPPGSKFKAKEIVQGGVERAFSAIFENGLVPWMLRERGADIDPPNSGKGTRIESLTIKQSKKDTEDTYKPVHGKVDESYKLEVTLEGKATLDAVSSTGVLRGLETFSQLFYKATDGQRFYTDMAPVEIEDEPKYPHRGLLLDVGRHWFEIDDIKRTIDALAMNKMNILHLHVTETQSWPLEIPALPKLTEKGAYAKGLTYSPADLDDLHQYAIHRGVQMYLELDMPGHVGVEAAYPGLTVAFNEQPYQWYCAQPPCGAFKLNDTDVEDFLDTLFEDLFPRISPYSGYFHSGGDEYKANNSLLDPALKTNDEAVLQPMLQRFLDHVHGATVKAGLVPMVWEEMVLEWNATVPEGTVIQSWLGEGAVKELAEAGHKVIDSSYEVYYLDCGRGQWLDFPNGNTWKTFYPFNDWCAPTKNWRFMYSHDPADGVSEEAKKNVLGGEMPVWTETIDPASLDTIIWPRAGAAAEVWWSGRVDEDGKNRTQTDARPRLSEQRERMLKRGVKGAVITQQWCDMNDVEDCTHTEV